jgi:hypothetical protein
MKRLKNRFNKLMLERMVEKYSYNFQKSFSPFSPLPSSREVKKKDTK